MNTKLRINIELNMIKFDLIQIGGYFRHNAEYYIKTCPIDNGLTRLNCVRLETGYYNFLEANIKVNFLKEIEMIIK